MFTYPRLRSFASSLLPVLSLIPALSARPEVLPLPETPAPKTVPAAVMESLYETVKTPHKYGVVIQGEKGEQVDCPNVFRHGDKWYMLYAAIKDKVGYQTFLASSDDLLHWEKLGPVLTFQDETWDAWQADGGISLYDITWGGSYELGTHDGRYWLSYIGGALQGYETDPLSIGLASTLDPAAPEEWTRLPENPVLAPHDSDVRAWENVTLYKSSIIRDEAGHTGYPFIMYYNGKTKQGNHEAIGMAVSEDMRHWIRMGADPIVDNMPGKAAITGDPHIAKIGEVYVMFYFGLHWRPGTFDNFAASYDLIHWTQWEGEVLIKPGEPFDKTFAHKPWVMQHDGVVYHYYCAVGKQGRVIALATSEDLRAAGD